jgi:hypothetical protein
VNGTVITLQLNVQNIVNGKDQNTISTFKIFILLILFYNHQQKTFIGMPDCIRLKQKGAIEESDMCQNYYELWFPFFIEHSRNCCDKCYRGITLLQIVIHHTKLVVSEVRI